MVGSLVLILTIFTLAYSFLASAIFNLYERCPNMEKGEYGIQQIKGSMGTRGLLFHYKLWKL